MATVTAIHHTGINPLRGVSDNAEAIKGAATAAAQGIFPRYHDSNDWPLLREALKAIGRIDLIGSRSEQVRARASATGHAPLCARGHAERCLILADGSKGARHRRPRKTLLQRPKHDKGRDGRCN